QLLYYDIDVFVAIAAVSEGGPFRDVTMRKSREIYDVKVFSTMTSIHNATRKVVEQGYGKIIFISSMTVITTTPYVGPYTATKHAIEAIAATMQKELESHGVQVATINPGAFATGFNDRSAEAKWKWYDEKIHFTDKEEMKEADKALENQYDPADMI